MVRPLDSAIRSQTIIENEMTTIVINSRHPLFVKRTGDIWYQLETAAREIFKSSDGTTVADFERRVNEVMLLAFQLRARRRTGTIAKKIRQLPLLG